MKKIKPVKISNSIIYDNSFIYLQSMCSFGYDHMTELENQILELSKTNCSLIRLSIRNEDEIEIAKKFREKYERDDFVFVADTHFLPKLAILSIKNGFKKVRINPGNMNFTDMNLIAKIAKDYDATIRIGLNGGSVYEKLGPYNISKIEQKNGRSNEKYISDKYINKVIDLFSKYLEPFEKQGFEKLVLSSKFSDYIIASEINEKLAKKFLYPIHLGVTEAGTKTRSTILHTLFLQRMIGKGIGSTVRISITGDSIEEIDVGNEILKSLSVYKGINIISCPTCGRTWGNLTGYVNQLTNLIKPIEYRIFKKENMLNKPITVAIMGCEVNGPGEAKEADFGVSLAKDCAILFSKGKIVGKIQKERINQSLIDFINEKINESNKKF